MLSCNDIEKINNEIIGNSIDVNIFNNMKWEIKTYYINESNKNNKNKEISYSETLTNKKIIEI